MPHVNRFGLHVFVQDRRIKRPAYTDPVTAVTAMMSAAKAESADTDAHAAVFVRLYGLQKDAVGPESGRFHPYFGDGLIDISLVVESPRAAAAFGDDGNPIEMAWRFHVNFDVIRMNGRTRVSHHDGPGPRGHSEQAKQSRNQQNAR